MISLQVETAEAEAKLARIGRSLNRKGLLKAIGERQLGWINDNFEQEGALGGESWAPLSPNTVAGRRNGSSAILQDTGKMRASFSYHVSDDVDAVWVGTTSQIAEYHQDGTPPYTIRPVTAKCLSFMTANGKVCVKFVNHPGLPARPMLPTIQKATELSIDLLKAHVQFISEGEPPSGEG